METPSERRNKKEKGHIRYNPNEGFMLSVSWILRNRKVAEDMLKDGLALCARATLRDTPCVPLYFFRTSYNQIDAAVYDKSINTIGEHPHYAKVYKSIELGTPLIFCQNKLSAGGIDATPLSWDPSTKFDEEKREQLGFKPVTISLSEYYLDSTSFFEHADSSDYLKAYGVVMQGHRSLKANSRCLGTPTEYMFNEVLSPYLQVEMVPEYLLEFKNDQKPSTDGVFSGFLEFAFEFEINWKDITKLFFDLFHTPVKAAFRHENEIRVEMSFSLEKDLVGVCEQLGKFKLLGGQMFAFGDTEMSRPEKLPTQILFHTQEAHGGEEFYGKNETSAWAGYLVHPKFLQVVADETVAWKKG